MTKALATTGFVLSILSVVGGYSCTEMSLVGSPVGGVGFRSATRNRMMGRLGHLRPRLWSQSVGVEDTSPTSLRASMRFKNFEEMLKLFPATIVLVNFHAAWCGPCKVMKKELARLSNMVGDRVKVFTVDTDRWPKLGARYEVSGLPTVLIFKNGRVCDRFEGIQKAEELVRRLENFMVD